MKKSDDGADTEQLVVEIALRFPAASPRRLSYLLREENTKVNADTINMILTRRDLNSFTKRLAAISLQALADREALRKPATDENKPQHDDPQ
jgi:hypothetical protein